MKNYRAADGEDFSLWVGGVVVEMEGIKPSSKQETKSSCTCLSNFEKIGKTD